MMSASTAAGIIAGMTQATRELGVAWESLPEEQRSQLIANWRRVIDERPFGAPSEIIASIAHHPALADAWERVGGLIHESRFAYIQAIVRETLLADRPAT